MKTETKVRELIDAGADVNVATRVGITPLNEAVQTGYGAMIATLAAAGADVNAPFFDGSTVLQEAVRQGDNALVDVLICAGADVNAPFPDGSTALHYAARKGDGALMDVLIAAGADTDAIDRKGRTPQEIQNRRAFRRRLTWTIVIAASLTVAIFAFVGVRNLLMIWAVDSGDAGLARVAIAAGADKGVLRNSGADGIELLTNAAEEGSTYMVGTLVKSGIDVNSQNTRGTPLHYAAEYGQFPIVRQLIDARADVDAQNSLGSTPMHMIGLYWRRDVTPLPYQEIVEMLVSAGADVDAQGPNGYTPLHSTLSAIHRPALTPVLLNTGADVNARDNRERTPLHVMVKHLYIYWPNTHNSIPAEVGYETADLLIQAGASVNAVDGNTPLHIVFDNTDTKAIGQRLSRRSLANFLPVARTSIQ